jgi:cysteine desulfurase/selenocysteine lyase
MTQIAEASRPVALDPYAVRRDFPILARTVHGRPLVYLDSAATAQKPQIVLDAIHRAYVEENANIHRGVHWLSETATRAFETARAKVQRFLGAAEPREIVFTRNATEGINLVARTFGRGRVGRGDQVVISGMEHHSNIVPWQMLCEAQGAELRVVPIDDTGALDLDAFERLLTDRTRMVSVVHLSNSLGTINPVTDLVSLAHARRIPVLVDGAQAAHHLPVDVGALDCDFYVATGHKLYGPTGIGVLYGKAAHLEAMPPYQGGGDMIASVTFEKTTYNTIPYKFEAGTPHIAGAIGLGAAIDYIESLGRENIEATERDLLAYGTAALGGIPGLRLVGTAARKASILSFVIDGVHPHDVGTILDLEGVAVRTGHHCTMPVMDRYGIPGTARASLAVYNTREDIDALVRALAKVREVFG